MESKFIKDELDILDRKQRDFFDDIDANSKHGINLSYHFKGNESLFSITKKRYKKFIFALFNPDTYTNSFSFEYFMKYKLFCFNISFVLIIPITLILPNHLNKINMLKNKYMFDSIIRTNYINQQLGIKTNKNHINELNKYYKKMNER